MGYENWDQQDEGLRGDYLEFVDFQLDSSRTGLMWKKFHFSRSKPTVFLAMDV